MPILAEADEMTDPDRPVTRRELREELQALLQTVATKDDLKGFPTRDDPKGFATKNDLKAFATKDDLKGFPTRDDPKGFATKDDLDALRDQLRTHFDLSVEAFKSEFRWLHDWVEANVNGLVTRVDGLDAGHGAKLLSLETRVTHLENPGKRG